MVDRQIGISGHAGDGFTDGGEARFREDGGGSLNLYLRGDDFGPGCAGLRVSWAEAGRLYEFLGGYLRERAGKP